MAVVVTAVCSFCSCTGRPRGRRLQLLLRLLVCGRRFSARHPLCRVDERRAGKQARWVLVLLSYLFVLHAWVGKPAAYCLSLREGTIENNEAGSWASVFPASRKFPSGKQRCSQELGWMNGCFGQRGEQGSHTPGCLTCIGERRDPSPRWWAVSFLALELRKTQRSNQVSVGRIDGFRIVL